MIREPWCKSWPKNTKWNIERTRVCWVGPVDWIDFWEALKLWKTEGQRGDLLRELNTMDVFLLHPDWIFQHDLGLLWNCCYYYLDWRQSPTPPSLSVSLSPRLPEGAPSRVSIKLVCLYVYMCASTPLTLINDFKEKYRLWNPTNLSGLSKQHCSCPLPLALRKSVHSVLLM